MILGKRRLAAALAASAVVASGAMWAPPAQAATNCLPVPGGTLGSNVKVGPVETRIPAIADIVICAGGGTVPLARTTTTGGNCTVNCLTLYVGGGSVDLDGVSVSWTEDGVARSVPVDPVPVGGPPETCVFSVGSPEAPVRDCFIAIGPDDPTGLLDDVEAIIASAVGEVGNVVAFTCDQIPDWYDPNTGGYADFCTDPVAWNVAVTNYGVDASCDVLPVTYSDWGEEYRFCDNPSAWTTAFVDDAYEQCNYSIGPQHHPQHPWSYEPVYLCDDPVLWTQWAVGNLCNNLCELESLNSYVERVRQMAQEGVQIRIG